MPLSFGEVVGRSLFPSDAFRWRMGTRSIDVDHWLQPDDARSRDLLEKDLLSLRHPGRTFAALERATPAARAIGELVAAALAPHGFSLRAPRTHPLETAGHSVQEDLCLMERVDGVWVLTAGSVCFPTRWDLRSKLGGSLRHIHGGVPGYDDELGDRVDRFFDRMAPGAIAARLNWSLVGDPSRRLPARRRQAPDRLPSDPARALFVRIERQTLRRLADHEAIVFGIRIHVWPLGDVVDALPAERFAAELESMPAAVAHYKNLDGMRDHLVAWLRAGPG